MSYLLLQTKEEKEEFKLPTGTVLHFAHENQKMTRENIKDALTALGMYDLKDIMYSLMKASMIY